ncbi:hypothetical protein ACNJUF_21355, partial [Mycobacterium tuberculosis]
LRQGVSGPALHARAAHGRVAWRRIVALVLSGLLLALGLSALPARADAGSPGPLHLAGCVARQQPGDDPRKVLDAPARFDCRRAAAAWGPGDY